MHFVFLQWGSTKRHKVKYIFHLHFAYILVYLQYAHFFPPSSISSQDTVSSCTSLRAGVVQALLSPWALLGDIVWKISMTAMGTSTASQGSFSICLGTLWIKMQGMQLLFLQIISFPIPLPFFSPLLLPLLVPSSSPRIAFHKFWLYFQILWRWWDLGFFCKSFVWIAKIHSESHYLQWSTWLSWHQCFPLEIMPVWKDEIQIIVKGCYSCVS